MKLKDYIQGKRRGKEANELERKALQDPFLQDALDGFDVVKGDHWADIDKMEKRLVRQKPKRSSRRNWIWSAAAMLVVFLGTQIYRWINQDEVIKTSQQIENKSIAVDSLVLENQEITTEIPKISQNPDLIAQSKPAKQVKAKQSKAAARQKAKNKAQMAEDELVVVSFESQKKSEIARTVKANEMQVPELVIAENKEKTQSVDEAFQKQLSGKLSGVSRGNTKIRGIADRPTLAASKLVKGKIVDEFGKPLIGASVVIKNLPGIGVKTDLDGNFSLKISDYSDSTKLMASYVGYEKMEIPLLAENKTYQMQPDDKEIETVTVIGSLAQSKVSVAGSVTAENIKEIRPSKIKGRVIDEYGEPLIGAIVKVKNSDISTTTNLDGEFSMKVPNEVSDKLNVNFIGYEGAEVAINSSNLGDIKLSPDLALLEEVVVVGFGTKKNKLFSKTESFEIVKISPKNSSVDVVFENKKQFADFVKQHLKNDVCAEKPKKLNLILTLNSKGEIVEMQTKRFPCPEMKDELLRIFENAPNWTLKNKKMQVTIHL